MHIKENDKNIEELSYILITKENPFFINHKFSSPNDKNKNINYNKNYDFKAIYMTKFINFKQKSFTFLKLIRSFITNKEQENIIKTQSIKLIKGIKNNFTFLFKFDANLVFQVFKIIIYFFVKEVKLKNINAEWINEKLSEKVLNSNIEKNFIINKLLNIIFN